MKSVLLKLDEYEYKLLGKMKRQIKLRKDIEELNKKIEYLKKGDYDEKKSMVL